jgi:hypothetical protein
MVRRIAIGCLAMILAGLAAPAQADLVIYVQDTPVNAGGYGYLNVYLGSTNPGADAFDTYSVNLQITPVINTGGTLLFAANNPAGPSPGNAALGLQPYNYLSAANYIFSGDSTDGIAGVNGGNPPTGAPSPGATFFIQDQSFSSSEYVPPGNTPGPGGTTVLLASLLLDSLSTNVGETYAVSVVASLTGAPDTSFTNNSTPVNYSQDTSQPGFSGTITIGTSAIPEPASVVSGMTALVLIAGWHGVRRLRRSKGQSV